ncbi:MAG: 1-acyl-sn-glycerol-3-phosphate acyltransferase [Clostridia bacterium]|nr:1-acyl-sn-glycerol-3-phosphate acyltransferase [Clostridia bacterium]
MYYRHNLDYQYPETCDEHMITVKRVRELTFDTEYPYLPRGLIYKFMRGVYWLLLNTIVFPVMRLSHGLRIYGKRNLKKYKKALKNGAITISNHVFYWDYLAVLKAVRPHLAYFPAWKDNLEGPCGRLIRLSGGIPIPTGNIHAMIKCKQAMEDVIKEGKWLHFFPEGSMWFFYPDIRPLKKTVFQYAVRYEKPIIPISMSFRPRRGLLRLFGKGPTVDLHIAEPIWADKTKAPAEATEELRARAYHIMQVMNGVTPDSPTYNTDQDAAHYQKSM